MRQIVEAALEIRGLANEDLDAMTEYSRYILMKGTYHQQAKLVSGIKGNFLIRNREIAFR